MAKPEAANNKPVPVTPPKKAAPVPEARRPVEGKPPGEVALDNARRKASGVGLLAMKNELADLSGAPTAVQLRQDIKRMQQELQLTTIYVTHDQEEALAMADIVCVMYEGVIQQAASPLDIYLRPANRFVATFVGANNFLSVVGNGDGFALGSGGADLVGLAPGAPSGGIVAAIRPETLFVAGAKATPSDAGITIPATLREVSFIGREMEIFAVTRTGEPLKAVSRPDPGVIGMDQGSPIAFAVRSEDLLFFEDRDTGARI